MNIKRAYFGIALSFLVLLSVGGCGTANAPTELKNTEQSATLALVNAMLIDGTGGDPLPQAVLLITGDKILTFRPSSSPKVPAGVRTVDLGGATILPGFSNTHVHSVS